MIRPLLWAGGRENRVMSRQRRERSAGVPAGGMEFELGGMSLSLVAVVVLALCAISFWLGRQSVPASTSGSSTTPAAVDPAPVVDGGDVEQELTFFDRLEQAPELSAQGDERTVVAALAAKEDETPARSAPVPTRSEPVPASSQAEPSNALPVATGGPFLVQVLATTERTAAEAMAARLKARGFPANLSSGDFKGQVLFRVRVGGYADERSARRVAQAITDREGLQTWVTR